MAQYVENSPLVLPALSGADTLARLGDLWDCRTSTKVDYLYPPDWEIPKERLTSHPKRQQDYNMTHIKSTYDKTTSLKLGVSMSATLLFVKLNIGSVAFTITNQTSLTREEIHVFYDEENFVIRLLPEQSNAEQVANMDPVMLEKILSGKSRATHIVTEVTLGAQVLMTILFEEKVNRKFLDKTAKGLGKLIAGPIGSVLEAGLSTIEGAGGPNPPRTTITFESEPVMDKPKSIKEGFDLIHSINKKMNEQRPFPQLDDTTESSVPIRGAILRYFLVPIHHYLNKPIPVTPVFLQVSSDLMLEFQTMLNTLKDFSIKEAVVVTDPTIGLEEKPIQDEKIGYFAKRIVHEDHRLKQILYDDKNPMTEKVLEMQDRIQSSAIKQYDQAIDFYKKFTQGNKSLEDFHELLKFHREWLEGENIDQEIQLFVKQGKEQLSKIQAGDVTEDVKVEFLTSRDKVDEWKKTVSIDDTTGTSGTLGFKLLVHTSDAEDEGPPAGLLLSIFKLSMHLPEASIALTIPNVNPTEKLRMEIYTGKWEILTNLSGDGSEQYALDVIAAALGFGSPILSRFYQVIAAEAIMPETTPLALPLRESTIEKLPELITKLKDQCKDIIICESFVTLREVIIADADREAPKWKFVVTMEAIESVNESVISFFKLKSQLSDISANWVVATFDLQGAKDAPIFFAFLSGELKAVCHDALDLVILENQFLAAQQNNNDLDLDVLSPNAKTKTHFYPQRANFADQVVDLFKISYMTTATIHPVGIVDNENIREALIVVTAYSDTKDSEKSMLSALTRITLNKYPKLLPSLKGSHWSNAQGHFSGKVDVTVNKWTKQLQSDLYDFVFSTSEFLQKIGIVYRTMEECIKEQNKLVSRKSIGRKNKIGVFDDEPEPLPPYDPSDEVQKILGILRDANDNESSDAIQKIWENIEIQPIEKFLGISKILVTTAIDNGTTNEPEMEEFHHFRNLLNLVDHLIEIYPEATVPEPETSWTKWFMLQKKELLRDIAISYVNRLSESESEVIDKTVRSLNSGFFCQAVDSLAELQFDKWLITMQHAFKQIELKSILENLKEIVWTMKEAEFTEENYKFFWKNSKFQFLMMLGMQDVGVVEEVIIHQCTAGTVPLWIPLEIAAIIRKVMLEAVEGESSEPYLEEGWTDWKNVLRVFKRIVASADLPRKFLTIFRNNLIRNTELKTQLKDCGILFYLDEQKKWFIEPWELVTVEKAVETLLEFELILFPEEISNGQQQLSDSDIPMEPIRDESLSISEELVNFVRQRSPQFVKKLLILQTRRRKGPTLLNYTWNNVTCYREIMSLFKNVFQIPMEERLLAFKELEVGLQSLTSKISASNKAAIVQLLDKLREIVSKSENEKESLTLLKLIVEIQTDLNWGNLQLKHFIREFGDILNIQPDSESQSEMAAQFRETLEKWLMLGNPLEILDSFQEMLSYFFKNGSSQSSYLANLKIFVISSVGLVGSRQTEILNLLFPTPEGNSQVRPGILETNGIMVREGAIARLVILEDEIRPKFGVDAIVLLDIEESFGSLPEYKNLTREYQQLKERQMVSFAIACSNLTLVHFDSDAETESIPQDLKDLLELSMIEVVRQPDGPNSDILLVQNLPKDGDHDPDITPYNFKKLVDHVKASIVLTQVEIGMRVTPKIKLANINRRIRDEKSVISITDINKEELSPLFSQILETCSQIESNHRIRFCEWTNLLSTVWSPTILPPFPFHFRNIGAIFNYTRMLSKRVDVEQKIEAAFRHHDKEFLDYIEKQMTKLLQKLPENGAPIDEDWYEASWLSRNEKIKSTILNLVSSRLARIPSGCHPIEPNQAAITPCDDCATANAAIEIFNTQYPGEPAIEIIGYISTICETIWRHLLQSSVVIDMKFHEGLSTEFVLVYECLYNKEIDYNDPETQKFIKQVIDELTRRYADKISIIPAKRLMEVEVAKEYLAVPHVTNIFLEREDFDWDLPPVYLSLKLQVDDIANGVMKEYEDEGDDSGGKAWYYKYGMVRRLKDKVKIILETFAERNGLDFPEPKLRWDANSYLLQKFLGLMERKESVVNPAYTPHIVLEEFLTNIADEIRGRLKRENIRKMLRRHRRIQFRLAKYVRTDEYHPLISPIARQNLH